MSNSSNRYSLAKLRLHTGSIVGANRESNSEHDRALDEAIRAFDQRLAELEALEPSIQRNVLILLAARLFNHAYASLLLAEAGLMNDALGCERGLWETLAGYFLVNVDASAAELYSRDKFPRPYAVRERLKAAGYPQLGEDLRGMFSPVSNIMHLSRRAERWNLRWQSGSSAEVDVGGAHHPEEHEHLLGVFLAPFLQWFAMHHKNLSSQGKDVGGET